MNAKVKKSMPMITESNVRKTEDAVESTVSIPAGCTDPATAMDYWKYVYNFLDIPTCQRRLEVLQHSTACPACYAKVLALYQQLTEAKPDSVD